MINLTAYQEQRRRQREEQEMQAECAEAVQLGGQSPVINQVMAALTLEVVRRLITGTCPWMALYADMSRGELRAVDATPANAARAFGLRSQRGILAKPKREGGQR